MRTRILFSAGRATLVAATATLALATILVLAAPAAAQTPPPPVGTLFLTTSIGSSTPFTSGIDTDVPGVVTSGPCPAAADAFNILLEGPGGLSMFATLRTTVGFSTTAPISSGFGLSFTDTAATDTPPVTLTAGTYTVTLQCVSDPGSTVQGLFVSTVVFSSPTAWTVEQGPIPTPTPTSSGTATPTRAASTTTSPTGGSGGTGTGSGGALAYTGAAGAMLLFAGLALSVLGIGLRLAARRRRPG